MFDFASADMVLPLMQSAEFECALRRMGRDPLRLDCGTLVLRRRVCGLPVAMMPRVADARIEAALSHLHTAGHRGPVILSPAMPGTAPMTLGALPLMSGATQAHLALDAPEVMRAALKGKWRNRLVRAEAAGLTLNRYPLPTRRPHWLVQAATRQARARRYRLWPTPLTCAYASTHRRASLVFEASQNGTPVAAMLFLRHGSTATYHMGHTTAAGRALGAHTLLMWQAMHHLYRKGHRWIDLGLIDTEDAAGLARFKLGTGAQAVRTGGTWGRWPPLCHVLRPLARLDQRLMAC